LNGLGQLPLLFTPSEALLALTPESGFVSVAS
jgi:hypothetical protein